jgi:hypothetical protein
MNIIGFIAILLVQTAPPPGDAANVSATLLSRIAASAHQSGLKRDQGAVAAQNATEFQSWS